MTSVQIGTSGASKGHPRADDDVMGKNTCLPITFARIKIQA